MPNPIAGFDVLADAEQQINNAKDKRVETRARIGAELNATFKQYAQTPAVVALRSRVFQELLDMAPDQTGAFGLVVDTPEPEGPSGGPSVSAPAVLSTEPPTRSVVLLFGNDNDDNEVTEAFLHEGEMPSAYKVGETLASLRGCDYNVMPLNPLPEVLVANERLAKAREYVTDHPDGFLDSDVNSPLGKFVSGLIEILGR